MNRTLRALLHLSLPAYALLVVTGALSLVGTPPPSETPRVESPAGGPLVPGNRASFRAGARVRASSTAWRSDHFPLYVIDEEPHPAWVEKWMPHPADAERWIEVLLPEPAALQRLELDLASPREALGDTPRVVEVTCARAARVVWHERFELSGHGLRAPIACAATDRVRVRFEGGTVRLYELRLFDTPLPGAPAEPAP